MPLPTEKRKLQRYPANTLGRDFVVGDLHGCIEEFLLLLKLIKFDESTDRVFSVGDLVDRGPFSKLCAELIYRPWFYAIKGNHEDMMINTVLHDDRNASGTWYSNGGMWAITEDKTEMFDISTDLDALPLVIVVGEGANRFNIVHAELMHGTGGNEYGIGTRVPVTDQMIDDWVFTPFEEDAMIWGRSIISNGHPTFPPPAHQLWHDLDKMSLTYVGHTPVRETVICQRQMYIDNGAVFHHKSSNKSHDNKLVIASPSERVVYQWVMATEQMHVIPYDQIQQLA
jgi:serine/threonine protein phosphatase 1